MDIQIPTTFIAAIKHKHLLLDTNIFRDVASKPSVFNKFFSDLKSSDVTLTTIDYVKFELLKGSSSKEKYAEKEKFIDTVIDATTSVTTETNKLVYELIKKYGIDGSALSLTDLFLGAICMQYKKNIYLMTRDTTDFLQSVFDLSFVINIPNSRGIFTYGIYQYTK